MPDPSELFEKRQEAAKEIRLLAQVTNEEGREFTPEEQERWEKVNSDYDHISKQMEVQERLDRIDSSDAETLERFNQAAAQNRAKGVERLDKKVTAEEVGEAEMRAVEAWVLSRTGKKLSKDHSRAAERLQVNLDAQDMDFRLLGTRAISALQGQQRANTGMGVTSGEGGEWIPTGFVGQLERALLAYGGPRKVARVIRTESGNALHWPTVDDTGNSAALLAESAIVTLDTISTGEVVFNAYKYSSNLVQVTSELIQDNAFDIGAELASLLGERLGRGTAAAYTTGTGSSQPAGMVTAFTGGITAADTNSFTLNELIDLQHAVDPAYRAGRTNWMMHDSIMKVVRKFADSNGQYIWEASAQLGAPDTLFGEPIVINQHMSSAQTTGQHLFLYGDFSKFIIRDVASIRIRHLTERYADYDKEAFVAFMRTDSDDIASGAVKRLTLA